jgi:glyceraldehyde 3-phosphate dehydrogenase
MKEAASEIFGYTEEKYVSSDIVGLTCASLFDASQTLVCKVSDATYEVRVAAWFDNENSFASQMVRTVNHVAMTTSIGCKLSVEY